MELNEYQIKAMSTCMDSCANMTYMLTGLNAEIGEVNDKIAKAVRKGWIRINDDLLEFLPGCPRGWKNELMKEVGDCLWFVACMAYSLGWDLEEVAKLNLAKLASREQRGVIDGNGDNR